MHTRSLQQADCQWFSSQSASITPQDRCALSSPICSFYRLKSLHHSPPLLHSSVNSSCESRHYRCNQLHQCLLRWLRGNCGFNQDASASWCESSRNNAQASGNITAAWKLCLAKNTSLHHLAPLPLCLSVFLPGPLVRLMDDRVGREWQEIHFPAVFLILIWISASSSLTEVRTGHMTGLKHTELELYIQTKDLKESGY